jgi:putative ABC transport system permease protein
MTGVLAAEGSRDVPVRLVAGQHRYRTMLTGLPAGSGLRRVLDAQRRPVAMPQDGMLLTDRLAERLAVTPGDRVRVEMLQGERRTRDVLVAGTVADLIGLFAYMDLDALGRTIGERDTLTSLSVSLDEAQGDAALAGMKAYPRIATVSSKSAMLENFRATTARNVLFFTSILTAFAAVIAVGVVYNSARVTLHERAWELASLRVLGFTRHEVSTFLLGELAFELVVALPLGGALGYALSWTIVQMSHQDLVAIPVVVSAETYGLAAAAMLVAGIVSALIVRQRIDRLDLVAVLKTRE